MIGREFLARLTYGHGVTAVMSMSLVLLLFSGSFTAISITISTAFAYSTSTTNSSIMNKEIPVGVKSFIDNQIVNKSKAAIVVGFVDPNGTRIFSFGNMSKAHNIPVNQNTLFDIGSITKTLTTLLLADMVKQGIVNLNDPIEKYLPASVKVPDFNGHKITLEDLGTHTSGLPEMPPNIWLNNNIGVFKPNYDANQLYQALSNTKLTREPGSKFQYSSFGIGLLGHILSLRSGGIPYEQLVKDRILNVLGMNDTKITLSQNEIKNRFAVGHRGGKEISTPTIPAIIAGAGAFRSTAADLLKYVSANLGFLHTKLDDAIQLQHLIRISKTIGNPMNYSEYVALDYRVLTNLGTETFSHTGAINGWNANVAFTPTKQKGVVALCSCDSKDVDMGSLNWVLLHLTGVKSLTANSEIGIHTNPSIS
jgi:D-alanyl-D-alanine-carboxypeptidase/D-alanyl-D-alanine-endopeptidase